MMERLTTKNIMGGWTLKCPRQPAVDRLAAYEDIMYDADGNGVVTLDHLRDLLAAEADGRLLIAEYPIGTQVYQLTRSRMVERRTIDGAEYTRDVPADYITTHKYSFIDAIAHAENPEYRESGYGKLYTERAEAEKALGGDGDATDT